ncbi:nuclear transport factor 2 family protein [Pareuzebyella sediminis]|uniref:nuclear transport factor 2 family protein n=1 Tax=Pareuzebyella sediminis TaxID=2607998 RepID=UPI0011EC7162|nr:nuclear transport factor 2 family protein [Pareuzebyella sediminis]
MSKQVLALLLFTSFTLVSFGQSKSDETTIKNTVDVLYDAMVNKKNDILEKLTSEKLSYGHSSGTIEDKRTYIDAVMNGPFDFISITPKDQTISISDKTAVVRHIFEAEGINAGEPVDVRIGAMLIFLKQHDNWKLIARQAYKL